MRRANHRLREGLLPTTTTAPQATRPAAPLAQAASTRTALATRDLPSRTPRATDGRFATTASPAAFAEQAGIPPVVPPVPGERRSRSTRLAPASRAAGETRPGWRRASPGQPAPRPGEA